MSLSNLEAYRLILDSAYKIVKFEKFKSIDPEVLARYALAIVKTENHGFSIGLGKNLAGAIGFMQVKHIAQIDVETKFLKIPERGEKALFEYKYNAFIGTAYFAYQLLRYDGNTEKAIVAYNVGHYDPDSESGQEYLRKALKNYSQFDFATMRNQLSGDVVKNDSGNDVGMDFNDYLLIAFFGGLLIHLSFKYIFK